MLNEIMLRTLQRLYNEDKITLEQIAPEYQPYIIQATSDAPEQNT